VRPVSEICQLRGFADAMPFFDARLADGNSVHAVLGTLASPGTCISLRVPAHRSFSLEDCVASGPVTPERRNCWHA
jgi:pilus assembly protein CpaF